jgi:hypothetical protein
MREFEAYGPHEVPVQQSHRWVDEDRLGTWWSETDRVDLANRRGCYVFAMRHGRGTLPAYVGMTAVQRFRSECFSPRNLKELNKLLAATHGTLVLYLVAPVGAGPTGKETIKDLERYLIGLAAVRNPNLINIKGKDVPRPLWTMPGIGGGEASGRPHKAARDLARVLGVKDRRGN